MTVDEMIEAFGADTRVFPEEAVQAAIAQQAEVTPALLEIIERAVAQPDVWAKDARVFSTVFALYLLGQFREKAAYRPAIRLAQLSAQHVEAIVGDFITDGFPRCLASVFDGDCEPLHQLIENEDAEEFARASGVAALKNLVVGDVLDRSIVLEYYRHLLTKGLERQPSYVWAEVVCCALDLYPDGLESDLETAFEDGFVDPFVVGPDEIAQTVKEGRDKTLARTRRECEPYIEDTVSEFGQWAWWKGEDRFDVRGEVIERQFPEDPYALEPLPVAHPIRTGPKVGRNEPCPCGSGKKYKKCCGRA